METLKPDSVPSGRPSDPPPPAMSRRCPYCVPLGTCVCFPFIHRFLKHMLSPGACPLVGTLQGETLWLVFFPVSSSLK